MQCRDWGKRESKLWEKGNIVTVDYKAARNLIESLSKSLEDKFLSSAPYIYIKYSQESYNKSELVENISYKS